jgi:hypothetical protein
MRINKAEITRITGFFSLKRLEKNSGRVMALFARMLYLRRRFAVTSQLKYVPIARPIATHAASATPHQYATPGSPIRSHPLISDASALIAVTQGPSDLPPRKNASLFLFAFFA